MPVIRPEIPADYPAIEYILRVCFARDGQDESFNEWTLVDRIRRDPGYIPGLSLVAVHEGEILGHVMFSRCTIGGTASLAMAPLAVFPPYQRQGVGAILVRAGLDAAREQGFASCTVLGGPYYTRFGFRRDPGVHLLDGLDEHLYVLALRPGGLDGVSGQVRYCAPFYDEKGQLL